MLEGVDRVLVAVRDLDKAIRSYEYLLDGVVEHRWSSEVLNADVAVLRIGGSFVELCSPKGTGIISDRLTRREGLVFGGSCVSKLDEYTAYLDEKGVRYTRGDGRIYIAGTELYGLPLVVSEGRKEVDRSPGAIVMHLYELTVVLNTKWEHVAQDYSERLGIDRIHEVPITFDRFGYVGTLLKYRSDTLDRIELAEAHDERYAMGRFSQRHGDGLYMCYIETDNLAEIIRRLEAVNGKWTRRTTEPVERDGLWVHPSMLHGVLLGVSRSTLAWGWSGQPDKVLPQ